MTTQAGKEAQQDARRNQDALVNVAAAEGSVWQPVLQRFEPYSVLTALARREEETG